MLASAIAMAAGGGGDDQKTSGASDRGLPQAGEPSNVKPADFSTTTGLVIPRETARPEPKRQELKLYAVASESYEPGSRAALVKYTPAE